MPSICIVERFIRSLKQECTRRMPIVPFTLGTLRRELGAYATWYNTSRPHTHLYGRTPQEVFEGRLNRRRRFETRPRMPVRDAIRCEMLGLVVGELAGRTHLPVIELRRAA